MVTSASGYLRWVTWGNSCSCHSLKSVTSSRHTLRSPAEEQNPQVDRRQDPPKSQTFRFADCMLYQSRNLWKVIRATLFGFWRLQNCYYNCIPFWGVGGCGVDSEKRQYFFTFLFYYKQPGSISMGNMLNIKSDKCSR